MPEFDLIKKNVEKVRERMANACAAAGRPADDVALCAVTKYRSVEEMRAVLAAGAGIIGENRVQEAEDKIRHFEQRDFAFHMIGHLQTNKARSAAQLFDAVQSVDSLRLARMLDAEAANTGRVLEIYVQVNSSGEDSKSGLAPDAFLDQAGGIAQLENLRLTGVMTLGPLSTDRDAVRRAFGLTRDLFEQLRAGNPDVKNLSMGMTDDLEIAIAEGSTQVRVGRALFQG